VSDEQQKSEERLAHYIERHQLVSAMNNTKWREVVAMLQSMPGFHVEFRVRCVQDLLDAPVHRERSLPWHVPAYKAIEWLDIDPVISWPSGALDCGRGRDFTEAVLTALKAIPVAVSLADGYSRIWGYYRRGCAPDLL